MPRTRPPYPPEFQREALSLMRSGARTPKQLAAELGCSEQTLAAWRRQDEADRGERADVLSTDERARMRELEREVKVLRQEREILKRAAAFFVGRSSRPARPQRGTRRSNRACQRHAQGQLFFGAPRRWLRRVGSCRARWKPAIGICFDNRREYEHR
jgi:transposase